MLSWPPARCGMRWSTSWTRKGNSLRHPFHRPSCWPNNTSLFWRYGTGASMSVRLGMSVRAVASRLWNRLPMDCCRRILTNSTGMGEMLTPIHHRPKFSAATQAVAQPQAEEGQPKVAGPENSPPLLPNESARPASSRESRRRQALNLSWPTCVRVRRGGSAWPGGLRFGRRGYSEHRMLLVEGLPLHCTAPRQLRILPLLTRGIASQHLFRTTGFQPFLP